MTCGDGPAVRWSQRVEALDAAGRSSRFSLPLSRGLQLDFEIHLFASFDLELLLGALATRTDHGDAVPAGLDQQPAPQGRELLAGAARTPGPVGARRRRCGPGSSGTPRRREPGSWRVPTKRPSR